LCSFPRQAKRHWFCAPREIPECRSTNGVVTVSPEDLTSSSGLATASAALVRGAPVRAFIVPRPDGSIKAYVLIYLTGTHLSSQIAARQALEGRRSR